MADHYTQISFQIELPDEEIARQAVALFSEIEEALEDEEKLKSDFPAFMGFEWGGGVRMEVEGNEVWIHDDCGCPETEFLVQFLQLVLNRFTPASTFGFEWANTCSKPALDSFGGGSVFITKDNVEWMNTSQWLSDQQKAHRETSEQKGAA